MAATFDVKLDRGGSNGSPGNKDTITNLRFKTADDNDQDTSNPIPIVAGQTKRSYWRHVYMKCTVAPTTKVDNIKFYTDGDGWTGCTLNVGEQFPTNTDAADTGYELATGTLGDTGDEMVANHSGITSKVDAFTKTQGSPLSGPSINEDGNLIDAVGEETDYLVLQLDVTDSASPGTLSQETLTIMYDEI